MHPLVYGHYPPVMKRNAGSRLPLLTAQESARVCGSFDFIGINHYGAIYVASDLGQLKQSLRDYANDEAVKYITCKNQETCVASMRYLMTNEVHKILETKVFLQTLIFCSKFLCSAISEFKEQGAV